MEFSPEEVEAVYKLAERLTGSNQAGNYRRDILVTNVQRRMQKLSCASLRDYLIVVANNPKERDQLISSLTIHTTFWFREFRQMSSVERVITESKLRDIKVLEAGCSTGQSTYSLAIFFHQLKAKGLIDSWKIIGFDIDPVSIATARAAIYQKSSYRQIPDQFSHLFLHGTGKTAGLYTLDKEIRSGCQFLVEDIRNIASRFEHGLYNLIVCRNLLIYFSPKDVNVIVRNFARLNREDGILCIGHNEFFDQDARDYEKIDTGVYISRRAGSRAEGLASLLAKTKTKATTAAPRPSSVQEPVETVAAPKTSGQNPIAKGRILVIDDSRTIVKTLERLLGSTGEFAVDTCLSAKQADELVEKHAYDLISLDLNMPETDGMTWLGGFRSKGHETPVIVVSGANMQEAETGLAAIKGGAQDFVEKDLLHSNPELVLARFQAMFAPQEKQQAPFVNKSLPYQPDFIAIGASTGGTQTLLKMLRDMPKPCPPMVVIQHILHSFAEPFAESLASASGLELYRGEYPAKLKANTLYMALGDSHLVADRNKRLRIDSGPAIKNHRPSVDALFDSIATHKFGRGVAILLTGMGSDGAAGMSALHAAGHFCFAQNQASCIVFGMPRAAIALNCVDFVGSPEQIREHLLPRLMEVNDPTRPLSA